MTDTVYIDAKPKRVTFRDCVDFDEDFVDLEVLSLVAVLIDPSKASGFRIIHAHGDTIHEVWEAPK